MGASRLHETDRIAALIGNLRSLGREAEELPDGLRIIPRPLQGRRWAAHHDHRMSHRSAHRPAHPRRRDRRHGYDRQDCGVRDALGADAAGLRMSWLDDADDLEDDFEGDFDESSIRTRPNPEGEPPAHQTSPSARGCAGGSSARRRPRQVLRPPRRGHRRGAHDHHHARQGSTTCRSSPAIRHQSSATHRETKAPSARIVGIIDRTSLLRRSADDTDQVERVIVANADQMLVVVAAAPARLVDRYLVAALDAGIRRSSSSPRSRIPPSSSAHVDGLAFRVFTSAQDQMPPNKMGNPGDSHRLRCRPAPEWASPRSSTRSSRRRCAPPAT